MAPPNSRATLKNYCLMQLGHPVIKINVDDDQLEACIDTALQYWQMFHADATRTDFLKHQLTQTDMDNGYIEIPSTIISVSRLFPLQAGQVTSGALFNVGFNLRASEIFGNLNNSIINYDMVMKHLALLDFEFNSKPQIEFNRHLDRIYSPSLATLSVGDYLLFEVLYALDGSEFPKLWNDLYIKKYVTALFKKQWGVNLKKFEGVQLPGGITLNGQAVYQEAVEEIKELEQEMRDTWELPLPFYMG